MLNNQLLIEITRGDVTEIVHRGTFGVANDQRVAVASAGDIDHPIYPRSPIKPLQALPLIESGAADRWHLSDPRAQVAARFYQAMVREPCMIAGTGRWCALAMQIVRGCLAVKGGAEGVYCGIIPRQRIGIALKIDDGGDRAAEALMGLLLLRYAGLDSDQTAKLEKLSLPAILNTEGNVVGETRLSGRL